MNLYKLGQFWGLAYNHKNNLRKTSRTYKE